MKQKTIILASGSPRRQELLLQIGIHPEIVVSHVKEVIDSAVPSRAVMSLAKQKAMDVAKNQPCGSLILGADTVVALEEKILGKPKTHDEAREMISSLSGRSHKVYTGVCLIKKEAKEDKIWSFYDETEVFVADMTREEIADYAASEEPMDKAGAYAVQGFFARYITKLSGSYANVMGLPVHLVYEKLKEIE